MMGEKATALQVFKNTVEVKIGSIGVYAGSEADKSKFRVEEREVMR